MIQSCMVFTEPYKYVLNFMHLKVFAEVGKAPTARRRVSGYHQAIGSEQ